MNNIQVKYDGPYRKHYTHKIYLKSIKDYIDVFHRIGMPAIEDSYGHKSWRFNGKPYRINGSPSTRVGYFILHDIRLRINIGKLVI